MNQLCLIDVSQSVSDVAPTKAALFELDITYWHRGKTSQHWSFPKIKTWIFAALSQGHIENTIKDARQTLADLFIVNIYTIYVTVIIVMTKKKAYLIRFYQGKCSKYFLLRHSSKIMTLLFLLVLPFQNGN